MSAPRNECLVVVARAGAWPDLLKSSSSLLVATRVKESEAIGAAATCWSRSCVPPRDDGEEEEEEALLLCQKISGAGRLPFL